MKERIDHSMRTISGEWIAVCLDCHTEIERCPNGIFAEGAARNHVKHTECNRVVVGYEIRNTEYKAKITTDIPFENKIIPLNVSTYGEAQAALEELVNNDPYCIGGSII